MDLSVAEKDAYNVARDKNFCSLLECENHRQTWQQHSTSPKSMLLSGFLLAIFCYFLNFILKPYYCKDTCFILLLCAIYHALCMPQIPAFSRTMDILLILNNSLLFAIEISNMQQILGGRDSFDSYPPRCCYLFLFCLEFVISLLIVALLLLLLLQMMLQCKSI
jgi:hypothetical protein